MLLIKDILISDRIFEVEFHCDLKKCKGACCWEGDYGAPVRQEEIEYIKNVLPKVREILPESNRLVLDQKGPTEYYNAPEVTGTTLLPDASCVYLIKGEDGIGQCAFEILYNQGLTDFKKPISCELYPIRLIENKEIGFTAMNYDEWDICSDACILGKKLSMPVFRFLKKGIIRRFGLPFYEELEAYFEHRQGVNPGGTH
jgi:hypothetical protein